MLLFIKRKSFEKFKWRNIQPQIILNLNSFILYRSNQNCFLNFADKKNVLTYINASILCKLRITFLTQTFQNRPT